MSMTAVPTPTPTASQAPASAEGLVEKISVRDLDFFYGDNRALKNINVPLYENKVTAFIGPSGCGKSTLLRILNRMYDLYPNQRAAGHVRLDDDGHPGAGPGPQSVARQGRHGVPEADAVPDDHLREHRLRHPALREAAEVRARRPCAALPAARRALGRGQGQAQRQRPVALRRPAAAPVHRAHGGGAAPKSSCSTSRARRSTRSPPPRSRS